MIHFIYTFILIFVLKTGSHCVHLADRPASPLTQRSLFAFLPKAGTMGLGEFGMVSMSCVPPHFHQSFSLLVRVEVGCRKRLMSPSTSYTSLGCMEYFNLLNLFCVCVHHIGLVFAEARRGSHGTGVSQLWAGMWVSGIGFRAFVQEQLLWLTEPSFQHFVSYSLLPYGYFPRFGAHKDLSLNPTFICKLETVPETFTMWIEF